MRLFALAAVLLVPGLALAQTLPRDGNAPSYGQPTQRQQQMPGMRAMDADNDGAVSRNEFMNAHQNADARFAATDADKDGAVSREEFLAAGQANSEARFQAMDSNGDGRLTREEVDTRRTAMFDAMDADKDGRITPAEMRRGGGRMMPPQQKSEVPR